LQLSEINQVLQEADQLREQLVWLQGQPKQVKRLAWDGRLSIQQAKTVLTECVRLATQIEAQLQKLAERLDETAAVQVGLHEQAPLSQFPTPARTSPDRSSRLG
jgi:hypothetical protein